MEGLPVVCYSTGTMNSVLDKLTMLKNHSNPTDEFSVEAEKLKNNLWSLKKDFVDKLSGRHVTQKQLKVCMKQVRELVFNIEDWIDQKPETNLVVDPSGSQKFEYFNANIHARHEHLKWYFALFEIESTKTGATPIQVTIYPRLLVEEKFCHAVLDGPRDKLVEHLTDNKEEMRKVVSVVGMEGLGKTSLAKEVFSDLQLRQLFECQAFVSVGRRPAMRKILEDILGQVNPGLQGIVHMQEIITELRKYLGTKRYFIVVDGIWSTWAWKIINCVLPNNLGSRVLTTTCIIDVARSCSSYPNDIVYQMEALSKENSRILFLSKTIALEEKEKWADSEEDLLKLCGGMPLAIIVAAGLLLARNSEAPAEVNMLWKSIIYSSLKQYSTSDGMTKILHMSYDDLSLPARSCFIYLSVFREYEIIMKDRLIRLWGAEGFIPKRDKECWWVTGERYFNELISRRLIQPVFTCDDDQAVGCTVHTVILDFIRSISREENFATRAIELNSSPFPCDTIRRFSLDCGMEDKAVPLSTSSLHLSSMRSLTVFGDVSGKIYPPDSPPDDESISDPQRLSSVSKHGKEMHGRATAFEARMRQPQSRMQSGRVIKDDEGKHDPPDSRAADERISGPEGLPSDSKQDEEMHATKAPGVGMMDQPSRDVEGIQGKHDPLDSLAADERISDPEGLPSDSKQGEDMEAPGVPTKILSAFKLLRVLDLEDTKNLKNYHLEGIGGLVLLRYLGLAGTGITKLPEEIGGLEQLETLDLRSNIWLTTFPESKVKLKKVRHLLLEGYAEEIWEMPALEVASGIRVESSSSLRTVEELLRKSEKLRMLGLIFSKAEPTETDLVSFLKEVVKSKLQSIYIGFSCYGLHKVIPLLLKSWKSVTAPPAEEFEPQRFELRITGKTDGALMRVPDNMGSLASLTHLHIILGQAKAEDFLVLDGLTNLVLLSLVVEEGSTFIIKGGILPCLKVFSFRIRNSWMGLEFEGGAMPQLQRLGRGFRVSERRNQAYPDIGIEHLTSLSRIHATINCQGVTGPEVVAAEAAIRGEISKIATKPALELSRRV